MLKRVTAMADRELKPITADPEFSAASETMTRLRARARDIQTELDEVDRELHERLTDALDGEDNRAAMALIAGDRTADCIEPLQARAERLRRDLASHRRAITLQSATLRDARDKATAEAALAAMPEHRRAVSAVLVAVAALKEAVAAENAVRRGMLEAGYNAGLRDFTPPKFILATDDAVVHGWTRDAKAYAG